MDTPTINNLNLIFSPGTQVVSRVEIRGADGRPLHPAGVVGVITASPVDHDHSYRVRFPDNFEAALKRTELITLRDFQITGMTQQYSVLTEFDLKKQIILQCVIGSRAYGLEHETSDTDRRGVYLPLAELHWSLYGVPEQLEDRETQECYWELQKFLVLALKANPNVLECLYSPIIETATPLGRELIDMRAAFLSRLVYQTYNGYVMSQFKKLTADIRNKGEVKWKHVMHLIRLLISGITVLREGHVPVRVEAERDKLLALKHDQMKWDDANAWRLALHEQFDAALANSPLPERPDYSRVNAFLLKARRTMAQEST
ncbi:MAG: nucleotidyltransferase domain-containing protein [Phycisphaerales bacterium]|nr:nucleotidyltransferase domain-containing protein [Phycisphaerales bacterium]